MSQSKNEIKLISQCLKNDRHSQNTLFKKYAGYALGISQRYVPDKQDAEDILLKAFYKAFTKLDQFDAEKGTFKSWLSRIVVNESLNHIRRDKSRFITSEDKNMQVVALPEVEGKLEVDNIHEIIRALPDPYGVIFNLVLDGYKYAEISKMLEIKEVTLRSYYMRARKRILEKIDLQKNKNLRYG